MRIVTRSEWERIENGQLPRHVGLIMDGNGRWAEGQGKPRVSGPQRRLNSHCLCSPGLPKIENPMGYFLCLLNRELEKVARRSELSLVFQGVARTLCYGSLRMPNYYL